VIIGDRRERQAPILAVLQLGAIKSPLDAVRAAIVASERAIMKWALALIATFMMLRASGNARTPAETTLQMQSWCKPFAAMQFDGSYNTARIGLIF
jgi:hypothetical protein